MIENVRKRLQTLANVRQRSPTLANGRKRSATLANGGKRTETVATARKHPKPAKHHIALETHSCHVAQFSRRGQNTPLVGSLHPFKRSPTFATARKRPKPAKKQTGKGMQTGRHTSPCAPTDTNARRDTQQNCQTDIGKVNLFRSCYIAPNESPAVFSLERYCVQ